MISQNALSAWLRPIKGGLKKVLPNIAEAWSGIRDEMNRDPKLKAEIKNNFYCGLAMDVAEAVAWYLPKKYLSKVLSAPTVSVAGRTTREMKNFFLGAVPKEYIALAGGWFDAKFYKGLFKANRRRVLRDINASSLEEEKGGILAAGMQTALDIRAGLRSDPKLKARFIGLAITEVVFDLVDAKMGISRNFPGLIASLLISQVVGLKELDWTAKAVKLGIQVRQQGKEVADLADVPGVRFMDIIGLKRAAQIISLGIQENPDLKSSLDKSHMGVKIGISVGTFCALNYVSKLISGQANENDILVLGVSEVVGGGMVAAGIVKEGVWLRRAFNEGQKLKAIQKFTSPLLHSQNYP